MGLIDYDEAARDLCAFIDASPSPYHAVAEVTRRLTEAGFTVLDEQQAWPTEPGRYLVTRGGSVAAWSTEHLGEGTPAATPFRVVGGHTDSPNLRISPHPDKDSAGWDQLVVEVYGGALLNSWLDRDLGLSGRVVVREPTAPHGVAERLVRVDEAVLRVPQLAIHLDRATNEGLALNPQTHLTPIWGATGRAPSFAGYLADLLQVTPRDVLAWDVMTHDLTPSGPLGRDGDLVAAPRLDNLGTAHAGTAALLAALDHLEDADHIPLLVLFDHEEIGSTTSSGGDSTFLPAVLERIVLAAGGGREDYLRAVAGTLIVSADMAHATHPNYAEKHESNHRIGINGGPVLKVNAKGRYASDAVGSAVFARACDQAGVPMQIFRSRGDMPCGSTIGPMSAALTGATTVDVGAPMLSMHSARELTGARDPGMYVAALTAALAPR